MCREGPARLEIAPGRSPLLEAAGIRRVEDALDPAIGSAVASSRSSWVRRVPAGERFLYVKCFVYPTLKDQVLRIVSRRFLRHRARREWMSLGLQEELGIPVVSRVCIGEVRHLGWLSGAVLVTEELPGARRLDHWLHDGGWRRADAPAAVGWWVALLHRAGFVHGDLNARNVLVREAGRGDVDLRSIDASRGRERRWSGRIGRAHLDDLAPLALAFRTLAPAGAERALVDGYCRGLCLEPGPGCVAMLEHAITRIAPRESVRLAQGRGAREGR